MSDEQQTTIYTHDQLHALACIVCGTAEQPLQRSGHVTVEVRPNQPLTWAVATCPQHRGEAPC